MSCQLPTGEGAGAVVAPVPDDPSEGQATATLVCLPGRIGPAHGADEATAGPGDSSASPGEAGWDEEARWWPTLAPRPSFPWASPEPLEPGPRITAEERKSL